MQTSADVGCLSGKTAAPFLVDHDWALWDCRCYNRQRGGQANSANEQSRHRPLGRVRGGAGPSGLSPIGDRSCCAKLHRSGDVSLDVLRDGGLKGARKPASLGDGGIAHWHTKRKRVEPLRVQPAGAISPNSAYHLNTTRGQSALDYAGTASVRQLWINGVPRPNGIHGAADTTAITGTGTLTVTDYDFNRWTNASDNSLWDGSSANWTSPPLWADGNSAFFDALGARGATQMPRLSGARPQVPFCSTAPPDKTSWPCRAGGRRFCRSC